MCSETENYINVAEDVDPLESLTGKLVWGQLANGKTFVSRLVKVDRPKLYFRDKSGQLYINDLRRIDEMREYVPWREAV